MTDADDQTRENAVNTIAEVWYEHQDGILDADRPDDAMVQVISQASDICEAHGIPEGERVDVVIDGIRQGMVKKVDESLTDLRFQLEVFSGL